MSNILVKTENVTKLYPPSTQALNGVSIEIEEGSFTVILGNSGSGKTTLLNLIGGLDTATSGSVICNGKDLSKASEKDLTIYRRVFSGFIFQSFNLLNELTVYENVCLTQPDEKRVLWALEKTGMLEKKDSYPSQLSGGQQQRVSIARALAKEGSMLLCDEPTGALDYETGRGILETLQNLCKEEGKTIILVTHTTEIAKLTDQVIFMKNGQIVQQYTNEKPLEVKDIQW